MAKKNKKQAPREKQNNLQKVNLEELEIQTTVNTDPISVLVEDGEVENAV